MASKRETHCASLSFILEEDGTMIAPGYWMFIYVPFTELGLI